MARRTPNLDITPQPLRQARVSCLARRTGFLQRKARKISPWLFLRTMCLVAIHSHPSLAYAAMMAATLACRAPSRQAIWARIGPKSVAFLREVTQSLLLTRSRAAGLIQAGVFQPFRRVLIQDSTVLALSPRLAKAFPGSSNQSGKRHAALKIQATYELKTETFLHFEPGPFTRNDQAASPDILSIARAGDLVLRDLGFFVLSVFQQMILGRIFFVSRLRHQVWIGLPNGETFDLLRHLRRDGFFDGQILLGCKDRVPVRLVALRVPPSLAAERRRRLRQNRDKRLRPCAEHLALLDWTLLITNVPPEIWSATTLAKVYGVRWRIEILFKAWKTHFSMTLLPDASPDYVLTLLWARLILITLACALFTPTLASTSDSPPRTLSSLKFASLFSLLLHHAWLPLHRLPQPQLLQILLRHSAYDLRLNRLNSIQSSNVLG